NELTRFRYDVVLHIGGAASQQQEIDWLNWKDWTIESLKEFLLDNEPGVVGIKRVRNRRLHDEAKALEWLETDARPDFVAEFRDLLNASPDETAVDPEDFWSIADRLPYSVDLSWMDATRDGSYDVLLKRRGSSTANGSPRLVSFASV